MYGVLEVFEANAQAQCAHVPEENAEDTKNPADEVAMESILKFAPPARYI